MSPRIDSSTVTVKPDQSGSFLYKLPQKSPPLTGIQIKNITLPPSADRLLESGLLNSIYQLGAWADRNLNARTSETAQTTVGAIGQTAAPIVVGTAVGIGAGYAAGYLCDTVRNRIKRR